MNSPYLRGNIGVDIAENESWKESKQKIIFFEDIIRIERPIARVNHAAPAEPIFGRADFGLRKLLLEHEVLRKVERCL